MAKYWIRGFFALLMTCVITGGLLFAVLYGIDCQVEVSTLQIETEAQLCRDAWGVSDSPCAHVSTLEPVPDPMGSQGEASVFRRLPPVMPDEYPEPTIVIPRQWDGSPSPWPGDQEVQPRSPYVEWLERQRVPSSVTPSEEPKPYTPGSTNPARRDEFRQRARPAPIPPGKVARL